MNLVLADFAESSSLALNQRFLSNFQKVSFIQRIRSHMLPSPFHTKTLLQRKWNGIFFPQLDGVHCPVEKASQHTENLGVEKRPRFVFRFLLFQKGENETIAKSGNPGYVVGKPILAGKSTIVIDEKGTNRYVHVTMVCKRVSTARTFLCTSGSGLGNS